MQQEIISINKISIIMRNIVESENLFPLQLHVNASNIIPAFLKYKGPAKPKKIGYNCDLFSYPLV